MSNIDNKVSVTPSRVRTLNPPIRRGALVHDQTSGASNILARRRRGTTSGEASDLGGAALAESLTRDVANTGLVEAGEVVDAVDGIRGLRSVSFL